jgi:Spy/CpxP family protein refolding chaperone
MAEKEVGMKRMVIWSCVALLLIVGAVAIARADAKQWHRWCGRGWGHPGALGYLAHKLDLSGEQRQQIRSMWQTEKPAMSSLVREFAAESKEMDEAAANGNLDESKVQEIAARQGATVAKLLVEKEHFKAKVYTTVLKPGQRTKADELQSRWHERLDHIGKF